MNKQSMANSLCHPLLVIRTTNRSQDNAYQGIFSKRDMNRFTTNCPSLLQLAPNYFHVLYRTRRLASIYRDSTTKNLESSWTTIYKEPVPSG